MATDKISFLFGKSRKVALSKIGLIDDVSIIEFDATLSESHDITAEITQHPVESGAKITDHYRVLPREITINGIVSNTPLTGLFSSVQGLISSAQRIGGALGLTQEQESPANQAYDKIYKSMKDGELLVIATTLKEYRNMLITSFSTRRDATNGNVLNATISLKEIKIAEIKTTSPEKALNAKDSANVDQGKKPLTGANDSQVSKANTGIANAFPARG